MPEFNFDLIMHEYCMQSSNSCLLTIVRKQTIQADVIKHCESVNALQTVLAEATTFITSISDALVDSEFVFQRLLSSWGDLFISSISSWYTFYLFGG